MSIFGGPIRNWQKKLDRELVRELAKGFRGRARNCYRISKERVQKKLTYQYKARRLNKRNYRKLAIQQVNAGVREHDINYSSFICGLNQTNVRINRRILANLASTEPYSFQGVVDYVKEEHPSFNKPQDPFMGHIFSHVNYTPKINYKKVMELHKEELIAIGAMPREAAPPKKTHFQDGRPVGN